MSTLERLHRVAFGLFEADLHAGELWKAGYRVKLPRQPFRVLATLLAKPGDLVTREELQLEIWGVNTNVDFDQALAAAINKIREALGDSAENPRFIQTHTKRGYRFIAPVTFTVPAAASQASAVVVEALPPGSTSAISASASGAEILQANSPASSAAPRTLGGLMTQPAEPSRTPVGLESREPPAEHWHQLGARDRSKWRIHPALLSLAIAAALLLSMVLAGRSLLPDPHKMAPARVDQVTHYIPVSLGPPNPESFLTLATDGDRVLTSVLVDGRPRLSAIDVNTGEVRPVAVPDEIASNSLADISRDGSRLLLRSNLSSESEQPLWVVPSAGGSGQRVSGTLAHDAAWMPDGRGILYANDNDLAEIRPNEEAPLHIATLPGRAFWLRWSPDEKLLRFTLFDPVAHSTALWEMDSASHTPHPVEISGFNHLSACCGVWLPDGKSYVFQANDNLWELTGFGRHARLTQLTNGPLRALSPVAARNGTRVFFVGLETPSGLQQLDSQQKEFRAAPAFLADATRIEFSRDGKWVAWTDNTERLWRARATDGSDKLRLTSDALEVYLAHWSPDGRHLAVMARKHGGVWQTYIVDATGGTAEALLNEARNAADPGWSADGGRLVFGREPDLMGKESGSHRLEVIDLATRKIEDIPDSEGLFSPRWSPDGHWIAALSLDQKRVMLYDVDRRHWRLLASTSAADPVWSADSKAIYVHAFLAGGDPILSLQVPGGAMQTAANLADFHNGEAANYFFGGLTPRNEPLVQPRVGTGNLYSLDLTP